MFILKYKKWSVVTDHNLKDPYRQGAVLRCQHKNKTKRI